jgi:putative endonuclease
MENMRTRGDVGENIAAKLLETMGFVIIDRNYLIRQGEIDIVVQRKGTIHFIEVKTSYGPYNPAENFHRTKLKRFLKAVRVYCYKHHISDEVIEIDLALVDMKNRRFNLVKHANIYFH